MKFKSDIGINCTSKEIENIQSIKILSKIKCNNRGKNVLNTQTELYVILGGEVHINNTSLKRFLYVKKLISGTVGVRF